MRHDLARASKSFGVGETTSAGARFHHCRERSLELSGPFTSKNCSDSECTARGFGLLPDVSPRTLGEPSRLPEDRDPARLRCHLLEQLQAFGH